MQSVCMGGLGSKFGIKCMTYNKVGMFYVLCGFYERKKKCFLYWKCGILWKSKMQRHMIVQPWAIASGPETLVYSPLYHLMQLLFCEYFTE